MANISQSVTPNDQMSLSTLKVWSSRDWGENQQYLLQSWTKLIVSEENDVLRPWAIENLVDYQPEVDKDK